MVDNILQFLHEFLLFAKNYLTALVLVFCSFPSADMPLSFVMIKDFFNPFGDFGVDLRQSFRHVFMYCI